MTNFIRTKKYLFVGGSMHGKVKTIPNRMYYEIPIKKNIKKRIYSVSEGNTVDDSTLYKKERYIRWKFVLGNNSLHLTNPHTTRQYFSFVLDNMDIFVLDNMDIENGETYVFLYDALFIAAGLKEKHTTRSDRDREI